MSYISHVRCTLRDPAGATTRCDGQLVVTEVVSYSRGRASSAGMEWRLQPTDVPAARGVRYVVELDDGRQGTVESTASGWLAGVDDLRPASAADSAEG